jgi:hypothetical protein
MIMRTIFALAVAATSGTHYVDPGTDPRRLSREKP